MSESPKKRSGRLWANPFPSSIFLVTGTKSVGMWGSSMIACRKRVGQCGGYELYALLFLEYQHYCKCSVHNNVVLYISDV